jgi:hypothetical protein
MMTAIVLNIESTQAGSILKLVKKLPGVKSATVASKNDLENISMLKACKAARRSKKVSRSEIINALN